MRHVAWLGALPPEVKGLADVNFDDRGSEFISVDFGEDGAMAGETKTIGEQVKEALASLFNGGSGTGKIIGDRPTERVFDTRWQIAF